MNTLWLQLAGIYCAYKLKPICPNKNYKLSGITDSSPRKTNLFVNKSIESIQNTNYTSNTTKRQNRSPYPCERYTRCSFVCTPCKLQIKNSQKSF